MYLAVFFVVAPLCAAGFFRLALRGWTTVAGALLVAMALMIFVWLAISGWFSQRLAAAAVLMQCGYIFASVIGYVLGTRRVGWME